MPGHSGIYILYSAGKILNMVNGYEKGYEIFLIFV